MVLFFFSTQQNPVQRLWSTVNVPVVVHAPARIWTYRNAILNVCQVARVRRGCGMMEKNAWNALSVPVMTKMVQFMNMESAVTNLAKSGKL